MTPGGILGSYGTSGRPPRQGRRPSVLLTFRSEVISRRSTHYFFRRGKVTQLPPDDSDHGCGALRYCEQLGVCLGWGAESCRLQMRTLQVLKV